MIDEQNDQNFSLKLEDIINEDIQRKTSKLKKDCQTKHKQKNNYNDRLEIKLQIHHDHLSQFLKDENERLIYFDIGINQIQENNDDNNYNHNNLLLIPPEYNQEQILPSLISDQYLCNDNNENFISDNNNFFNNTNYNNIKREINNGFENQNIDNDISNVLNNGFNNNIIHDFNNNNRNGNNHDFLQILEYPQYQSEQTIYPPFIIIRNYYTILKKPISKKRGPYRKYTIIDKEEIIRQLTDEQSIKKISRRYGIDQKTIKRWKEKGAERQPGGGRKVQDKIMEDQLFDALKIELQEKKTKIEKKIITRLARKFSNIQGFKASKGWYAKFNSRTKFEQYQADFLKKNQKQSS